MQPSVATYDTNGWVNTARTRKMGDWFSANLKLESVGELLTPEPAHITRALACGKYTATFPDATFDVVPVITWNEYPTGIFEIVTVSGVPVSPTPLAIIASYTDNWVNFRMASPTTPLHEIEYRYMCQLWSHTVGATTTRCYWMSSGTGSTFVDRYPSRPPSLKIEHYSPLADCTLDVAVELTQHVASQEQVWIKQSVPGDGYTGLENWLWNSDEDPHAWMGKLTGEFRIVSAEEAGAFIEDGIEVNGVTHRRPAIPGYTWTASKTISSRAGMTGAALTLFGFGNPTLQNEPGAATGHVSASELVFSSASIGLTDMDLRLGYDTATPPAAISYQGYTHATESCDARGEGNLLEYKSTCGGSGYALATWTNLGLSYKWNGDMRYVDGTAADPAPAFLDSNAKSFTGCLSPMYVYSGTWRLDMFNLTGTTRMANHSPETDWVTDHWARSENAPDNYSLRLTNAADYSDCESMELNPDTEEYDSKTDSRVLIPYPREAAVVSFAPADFQLDALNTTGASGIGGWAASGCTLAVVGGKLVATNVTVGSYIYRADYLIDDDPFRPAHWPFYRFCNIVADSKPLSLVVKRMQGQDTFAKTFSRCFDASGNGPTYRYDTCRPDGATGVDATQSGITQMQAEQTEQDQPYMELASTSWSWGIAGFDRIEIHLAADFDYTFESLACVHVHGEGYQNGVEVEREYGTSYAPGDTLTSAEAETYIRRKLYRQAIINSNGRWCAEIPAVKREVLDASGVITFSNYSVYQAFIEQKNAAATSNEWYMFPPDDFTSWPFTAALMFDPDWWDADNECYITENALFAADCCPVGFLSDLHNADSTHDPFGNASAPREIDAGLVARPVYDVIKPHPWYGTGRDELSGRQTCLEFRFAHRVRARVQGIAWKCSKAPDERGLTSYPVKIDADTIQSDAAGHYRSGQYKDTAEVYLSPTTTAAPLLNRTWRRVCGLLCGWRGRTGICG